MRGRFSARLFAAVIPIAACATSPAAPSAQAGAEAILAGSEDPLLGYQTLVSAPDRADEDLKLDQGRKPAEMMAFFAIRPGEQVAEIAAGAGYTAELLARAVGPTGKVWGMNRFALKFVKP